jgi:hypothetical protein
VVGSGLIGFLLLGRLFRRGALVLALVLALLLRHAQLILKHDPEKWIPVFGQDHARKTSMIPKSGYRFSVKDHAPKICD